MSKRGRTSVRPLFSSRAGIGYCTTAGVAALVSRRVTRQNGPTRLYALFFQSLSESFAMSSCVLAYSGGLDTSVILGWLQDEGYEVHAVYVDLGQPCEDRQATLDKARRCGAKS